MNFSKNNHLTDPELNPGSDIMSEAQQELQDSKKMFTELIKYRRSLYSTNPEQMKEIRGKAINALNNLFDDELNAEK